MNWFLHNSIADLYGPEFLLIYAATIVTLVLTCYRSVRVADRTIELDLPKITRKVDPYVIAYLRGGENEVTRVAIASLIQRGLLQITACESLVATTKKIDRRRTPLSGELTPIEARVMKWHGFPAYPHQVFRIGGIPASIKDHCRRYEEHLAAGNLLAPAEMKQLGALLWCFGTIVIVGLGGYKLTVAVNNGHRNVGFLVLFAAIGLIAQGIVCFARPRASRLGKAYLEQLKLAYDGLKCRVHPVGGGLSPLTMADDPGTRGMLRDRSAYADCLLMVGIFGMGSLADTPLADVTKLFKQGRVAEGGCGAGCGGGVGFVGHVVAVADVAAVADVVAAADVVVADVEGAEVEPHERMRPAGSRCRYRLPPAISGGRLSPPRCD